MDLFELSSKDHHSLPKYDITCIPNICAICECRAAAVGWCQGGRDWGVNAKIECDMAPKRENKTFHFAVFRFLSNFFFLFSYFCFWPLLKYMFVLFITSHHIFLLFFTLSVSADIKWAILHPEACMSPAAAQSLQKGGHMKSSL